jgi:hypothetical protein
LSDERLAALLHGFFHCEHNFTVLELTGGFLPA